MKLLSSGRLPLELIDKNPPPGVRCTPGRNTTKFWKSRPLSGRSLMDLLEKVPPRVSFVVSMSGASPVTVIDSVSVPGCNWKSIRASFATSRCTPVRSTFLKPEASTMTLYSPGCRLGARYSPASFVIKSRVALVPTLTMLTLALVTMALDLSVTVPKMRPRYVWAGTTVDSSNTSRTASEVLRVIVPPQLSFMRRSVVPNCRNSQSFWDGYHPGQPNYQPRTMLTYTGPTAYSARDHEQAHRSQIARCSQKRH